MIFIETGKVNGCVNQLNVERKGDCHNTYRVHMKDEQSGFYVCINFDDLDDRDSWFDHVSKMLEVYVMEERDHIKIKHEELFGGEVD